MPKVRKHSSPRVAPLPAAPSKLRSATFASIGAGLGAFLGAAIGNDPEGFIRDYVRFFESCLDTGLLDQIMATAKAKRQAPEPAAYEYMWIVVPIGCVRHPTLRKKLTKRLESFAVSGAKLTAMPDTTVSAVFKIGPFPPENLPNHIDAVQDLLRSLNIVAYVNSGPA
jgi:hypothetical protein